MSAHKPQTIAPHDPGLSRRTLGVPSITLMIIAASAPLTVVAGGVTTSFAVTGSFYAYVAQGLGRPLGVGGSLVALVSYNAMQVGIYGLFGFQLSMFFEAKLGFASPWWVWVLLCIIVVGVLGVNRVDLSAKVLGTLVALEPPTSPSSSLVCSTRSAPGRSRWASAPRRSSRLRRSLAQI